MGEPIRQDARETRVSAGERRSRRPPDPIDREQIIRGSPPPSHLDEEPISKIQFQSDRDPRRASGSIIIKSQNSGSQGSASVCFALDRSLRSIARSSGSSSHLARLTYYSIPIARLWPCEPARSGIASSSRSLVDGRARTARGSHVPAKPN